jgi:hypothetical protein
VRYALVVVVFACGGASSPRAPRSAPAAPTAAPTTPASSWWGTLSGGGEEVLATERHYRAPDPIADARFSVFVFPATGSATELPVASLQARDHGPGHDADVALTLDGPGFHRAWTVRYSEHSSGTGCEGVHRPCDPVVPMRDGSVRVALPLDQARPGTYQLRAILAGGPTATAELRIVTPALAKAYKLHEMGMAYFESTTMSVIRAPLAAGRAPVTFYVHRMIGDEAQVLELAISDPVDPIVASALDKIPVEAGIRRLTTGNRRTALWLTSERQIVAITITGESRMFEPAIQAYRSRYRG